MGGDGGCGSCWRFAGLGLIAANACNDAGGIATYASAGAQFGYQTLFVMVLVVGLLVGVAVLAVLYPARSVREKAAAQPGSQRTSADASPAGRGRAS